MLTRSVRCVCLCGKTFTYFRSISTSIAVTSFTFKTRLVCCVHCIRHTPSNVLRTMTSKRMQLIVVLIIKTKHLTRFAHSYTHRILHITQTSFSSSLFAHINYRWHEKKKAHIIISTLHYYWCAYDGLPYFLFFVCVCSFSCSAHFSVIHSFVR